MKKAASDLGIQVVAACRGADGEDASDQSAARRDHAHLAEHAGRRLVAAGVRSGAGAVHLHQHAGRREGRRPQREVRRDHLWPGRARHRGDRQRPADVRQPDSLEEDAQTPNLGSEDQTDDMRPGLGWTGVANLHDFVKKGGLLMTSMDTAEFAVTTGMTPGLSVAARKRLRIVGSVVRSKMVDNTSPIAYGYTDNLAIYCDNGPIFNVSQPRHRRRRAAARPGRRRQPATGRGTADDADSPQGRVGVDVPKDPKVETWQAVPITDEQMRNPINIIPPAQRPRVILRYADTRDLLVSGLVENGGEIAQHAAVVDVAARQGARRRLLEQPDLARRDAGQLLPGLQRDAEFRPAGCWQKA